MTEPTYREKIEGIASDPVWEELEKDGPCKDRTVWTASKVSTAASCLWAYHLAFEEGAQPEHRSAPAARGTGLHRTVNVLHSQNAWNDWRDVFQEQMQTTLDGEAEAGVPWRKEMDPEKERDFFFEDGAGIIGNYVKLNRHAPVIATEVPFRMIVQHPRTGTRYRMAGTLDQLRGDLRQPEVWDMKSNAAPPDLAYLARSYQFSTYGLALMDGVLLVNDEPVRFQTPPAKTVWYQLNYLLPYKRKGKHSDGTPYDVGDMRGDPVIDVKRTLEDYSFFREDICRAIQTVRMGLVWRSGAGNQTVCSMCRYRQACQTGMYAKSQGGIGLTAFAGDGKEGE